MEGGDDDKRKWPGGDVIRTPLINGEVRNTTGWRRGPIRWQEEIQVPVRSMFPSKLQGRGLESPINYSWPPKTNPPSRLQSSRLPRFWGSRLGLQWSKACQGSKQGSRLGSWLDSTRKWPAPCKTNATQIRIHSKAPSPLLHKVQASFFCTRLSSFQTGCKGSKVARGQVQGFNLHDSKVPSFRRQVPWFQDPWTSPARFTTAHRKYRSWEPNDTIDL